MHQAQTHRNRKKRTRESGMRAALRASAVNPRAEAPMTFLVDVSRKKTQWQIHLTGPRRSHPAANRVASARCRAQTCARPTRKGTHTRRGIRRRHSCDLDRFESILFVLRCFSSSGKPSTGKWCGQHRQEMPRRDLLRVLKLHRVSRRPHLRPALSSPKQSWRLALTMPPTPLESARHHLCCSRLTQHGAQHVTGRRKSVGYACEIRRLHLWIWIATENSRPHNWICT